ncbi:MAG: hypothetical protein WCG55_03115 [bacterium]
MNSDVIINEAQNLYDRWNTLGDFAKREIAEQITDRITIGGDEIKIKFSYNPVYFRNHPDWQRNLNRIRNLNSISVIYLSLANIPF